MNPYYFWEIELTLGCVGVLLLAGWIITRENRANLDRTNFQRLVALENQTLQEELATIRDEVARIAGVADSAKKAVTGIGNVMAEAIKVTELQLNKLKDRSPETMFDINELGQLRARIERIARFQKIAEERLSDEIRFNIERTRIADASLKGLASRTEAFSERLGVLVQGYSDLSAFVKSLPQSVLPLIADEPHEPAAHRAEYSITQPSRAENCCERQPFADAARPDDEAA